MDYKKIYDQICDRARSRKLTGYKERHHIIPKCLGGDNSKDNIVELTAREHFICHWLLYNIHPNNKKIVFSFWMMSKMGNSKQKRNYIPSSRIIEHLRIEKNKILSDKKKGKKLTGKHLLAIQDWHKNNKKKRSPLSEETKTKIGEANKGKTRSDEVKLNMKLYRKGRKLNLSDEERMSRSLRSKGVPKLEKTKHKISESKKGVPQKKLECPYCKKEGGVTNMKRYHFENCNRRIQDIYLK